MYDLIIVGGGPAGAAAAIYASRKRLQTLFITSEWGGQSIVSSEIQNWVGTKAISGTDLANALRGHVEAYAGDSLKIISPALATALATYDDHIEVTVSDGTKYHAKTLLIATGSSRRKLEVPGAAEFEMKGLTYCASCDGPLFAGQNVAVVGGGNAAFETALQLLAYCKMVTLLNRSENFRADEITVASVKVHENMRIITNAEILSIEGDTFVSGIKYRDVVSGSEMIIPVSGVFVEIGLIPNTDWVGTALDLTPAKQIKTDPRTQRASHARVWAAGDCTDTLYHQNNIAAGDAVRALEDIYLFVHRLHSAS
ncbi:MAG TPA: FAD-dependent oxidoreductase [Candidatus Paceibacterota bacterium]|nr:FAD-dependent oxidoreductase [Candidatus Paceibacterota bacterium]